MTDFILTLIPSFGYLGLTALIFFECGVLFGFIFPGDSVLFSAGIVAANGQLSIWLLAPLLAGAAIVGDMVGYWLGSRVGPALFSRDDSLFFKKRYLHETRDYFQKYGAFTIFIARFIPIVRTGAPLLAGVGMMPYGAFMRYNILGGVLWAAGLPIAGYWLGSAIPNIDHYILPIIAAIIATSFLPFAFRWWR